MDRLISLQAAIGAFLTELTKRERNNLLHTWTTVEVKYFITEMLEQMPAAESEAHVIKLRADIDKDAFLEAWKAAEKNLTTFIPCETTGWIPVTERLPEDEQNVLVTYKTTDKIHPCQYHADGSKNRWYSYIDQCRAHNNVVLAWMPLPEPYKED